MLRQIFLLLYSCLRWRGIIEAVEFEPFKPTESYKCSNFLRSTVNDRAMSGYYFVINQFIHVFSKPFPHQDLLDRRALSGDLDALRESFVHKYPLWIEHEQWWIVFSAGIVLITVLFTILYLFYRCCVCCFRRGKKPRTTDKPYDKWKRNFCNVLISFVIFINVFAAVALLISTQYATYGLEQLPSRLTNCIDDLNLYKRDTDLRVRKLLIDDFQQLNESIWKKIGKGGEEIVTKIKRKSGALTMDSLIEKGQRANSIMIRINEAQVRLTQINDDLMRFRRDFVKLRNNFSPDIASCVNDNFSNNPEFCSSTDKFLENLDNFSTTLDLQIISPETEDQLKRIIESNITTLFSASIKNFNQLEDEIQNELDRKQFSAQNAIKNIGDTLFRIAETISTQIRQVNFDFMYNKVAVLAEHDGPYQQYVYYSWYFSLVLSALIAFIALSFLLGLFYGCCGRRPTYYNDDCCVRSTGSKFYSCGIWMCLFLFAALSLVAAIVMLIGANFSSLICHPLEDPLSRTDMLSLSEKLIEIYYANKPQGDFALFTDNRMPADLIRGCYRNETFYRMFQLDKKYHLSELKSYEEVLGQLEKHLEAMTNNLDVNSGGKNLFSPENLKLLEKLSTIELSSNSINVIQQLQNELSTLDMQPKIKAFKEKNRDQVTPQVVKRIFASLDELDKERTQPLMKNLDEMVQDLISVQHNMENLSFSPAEEIPKLQHATAMLGADMPAFLKEAAFDFGRSLIHDINDYIQHLNYSMSNEITSCVPIREIFVGSRLAMCAHAVYPLNGVWMSLTISLLLMVPIIMMSTSLKKLYNRMHPYPVYTVHEPVTTTDNMYAFSTDTYAVCSRNKPSPYANMYDYQELRPPPSYMTSSRPRRKL